MIGYIDGATDGFEQNYDAESFSLSSDVFFSKAEDKRLLIQGKGNFFDTDKVFLGANFFSTGNYTISLDSPEGIFAGSQNIYLRDNVTNEVTNLSAGNYTFSTNAGLSEGRFEVWYKNGTVLSDSNVAKDGIVVYRSGNDFIVKSEGKPITNLEVYDASGRLYSKQNLKKNETTVDGARLSSGIYFLKIERNNEVTIKKIVK